MAQTRERELEEIEGQGVGFFLKKPPRRASNHISKDLAAWSGTGWLKLKEVALGAVRALPRYYDLPPPQLSLVMLWWSQITVLM